MDQLVLDNKKCISSKRAAQLTAYTTDYIGQLCRAEKIDGTLVGRNWYVNEESILNHKKGGRKQEEPLRTLSPYASEPLQYVNDRSRKENTIFGRNTTMQYKEDPRTLNPEPKKPIINEVKQLIQTRPQEILEVPTTVARRSSQVVRTIDKEEQLKDAYEAPEVRFEVEEGTRSGNFIFPALALGAVLLLGVFVFSSIFAEGVASYTSTSAEVSSSIQFSGLRGLLSALLP